MRPVRGRVPRAVAGGGRRACRALLVAAVCASAGACSRDPQPPPGPRPQSDPTEIADGAPDRTDHDPDRTRAELQRKYFESQSGRFRALTPRDDDDEIARLEALGYVGGSREPPSVNGITVHDRGRAWPGLNFYTSGDSASAVLMDMEGTVLHRWRKDFLDVWPGEIEAAEKLGAKHWRRAYLYPDGHVLAIFEGQGIIKVDADSRLVWSNRSSRAHHDLDVMADGDIYILGRKARRIPRLSDARPILEEFVMVLGPDGREKRRVSLIECWLNAPEYDDIWRGRASEGGDVFHTNTLEVLDGRAEHLVPAFTSGHVLISSKNTHAIAVVDLEQEKVVWAHVGSYRHQHDPTILDGGRLLLFDNRGQVGRSAVLEYRLPEMGLVWSYVGTDQRPFYSHTCGASQRLPNF